jgi:putative PIN family toxin of toxin-antitoxin system
LNAEAKSNLIPAGAVQPALPGHKAPSPEARGSDTQCATKGGRSIVLDTNIVLDVFVFNDAASAPLKQALEAGELNWLATPPMRDELARVLTYPQIIPRLNFYQLTAEDVLAAFDRHAQITAVAAKALVTCSDADDQKFIDLAVAHQALLLSKDQHVLSMRKRLLAHGIRAQAAI